MSTRIMTLFGEEIVPEPQKPAGKGRAGKQKKEDNSEDTEQEPAAEAVADEQEGKPEQEIDFVITTDQEPIHEPDFVVVTEQTTEQHSEVDDVTGESAATTEQDAMHEPDFVIVAEQATETDAQIDDVAAESAAASEQDAMHEPDFVIVAEQATETGAQIDDVAAESAATNEQDAMHEPDFVIVAEQADLQTTSAQSVSDDSTEATVLQETATESATEAEISTEVPEQKAAKKTTAPKTPKVKEEGANAPAIIPEDWKGEKNYYAIGEVATLFGVNTSHIRFWTNEFKLKVRTTRKGDRLYTPDQVKELRAIYHLVKERGFTLAGAKSKLKAENRRDITTIDLKDSLLALRSKLQLLRDQI